MTDRRHLVAFDPDRFAKHAETDGLTDSLSIFRYAHRHNLWDGSETPSGPGSSRMQTAAIAEALPRLCHRYGVRALLDVPCGTFHWMAHVSLPGVSYTGGDIVPEVVAEAVRRHGTPSRRFLEIDLTSSALPAADLLLCRDCFVHLSYSDVVKAMDNIRQSRIKYLVATTFTAETKFRDIRTGDWRPINLEASPFGFPRPIELVREGCTEQDGAFSDKSLGLWHVRDLPDLSASGEQSNLGDDR